ncbi:MAG: glycosyltransferase family 39 protein [Anaerolineae bacterium]|nr:glycosyltransferase family 39 protein [Phycisphaerae bacterium]
MTVLEYSTPAARRTPRSRWVTPLVLAPIILATLASIAWSLWSMEYRLTMPWPQNPWESAIIADAWRFAHGQPLYERLPAGHATHLYGPLTSPTIGVIFKIFGTTNFYVGRTIVMISSLAMCAIILLIYSPRKPLAMFISAGLLLALHYRGRAYFVETRPDMVAALLATLSLVAFYRAHVRQKPWLYLPGIGLLIGAMLFKQTYAAFAAAPLLAVLIERATLRSTNNLRRDVLLALTPLGAMVVVMLAIKFLTPNVAYYMFTVPAMYEIKWKARGLIAAASLVMLSPLFVVLAMWLVLDERRRELRDPKMLWLLSTLLIGCGVGIIAYAKYGGSYNSLLLGFIPMTAFCIALIDPVLRRLSDTSANEITRLAGGWLIGLLILVTTFSVPNSDLWNFEGAHGGRDYAAAVNSVRKLKGRVIIPDDPTILIAAKDQVCRSFDAELDAKGRPGQLPLGLYKDLAAADWLVRVHGHYDGWYTPELMVDMGFERLPTKEAGQAFKKIYSLWKRVKPAATQPAEPVRPKRRSMPAR